MGISYCRTWMVLSAIGILAADVQATFHIMQIEQVIAGVNGDVSAQAIQLRMRAPVENFVHHSRIRAWDATGSNPIMIIDIGMDVPNGQTGDRVIIATPSFVAATDPSAVVDFFMTATIPESYLAAGSLTFEQDNATIYWRLSWGGMSYTGPTTGHTDNDLDGNYGPPFAGPLPSTTLQALRFTGTATARSTTNAADYQVTAAASVFINNARNSFTVVPMVGDIDGDHDVDTADFARCVACLAGPGGSVPLSCTEAEFTACDLHEDEGVDLLDVAELVLVVSAP